MRKIIHFWIVAYETKSSPGPDGEPRQLMSLGAWQDITPLSRTWRIARKSLPHDSFEGVGVRTGYPLHVVIRDWSGVDYYGFNDYRPPWVVAADPRPLSFLRSSG